MTEHTMPEKTLVFCTAFVSPHGDRYYDWNARYRIWLEAVRRSGLDHEQALLVDDGSEVLPNWDDVTILTGSDLRCDAPTVLYHFGDHLGRQGVSEFPGWVRSFFFAARYAEANGFTRLIHLEADAFLISRRAQDRVNQLHDGWTAFWCNRFNRPESGIQVIAGSALQKFKEWAMRPIESFSGLVIEKTLPFTALERDLIGDRYGEGEPNRVPRGADWSMQTHPGKKADWGEYFWWMHWFNDVFPSYRSTSVNVDPLAISNAQLAHGGIYYLNWLREANAILSPETYFEIGTHAGDSLKMISCDAVCVDPNFVISSNVLFRRRHTHFFQGTSDDFFATDLVGPRFFPSGIDMAFLDGLHLFEVLLTDFINTERHTRRHSVILLHDCLPLNERMAERERRSGGDDEVAGIRDFWTGDVWKVVPILKEYRPDLVLTYLDCPPTGLVVCTGLDPESTLLPDHYDEIVARFAQVSLSAFGLKRLWELCPMFSAGQVVGSRESLTRAIFREVRPAQALEADAAIPAAATVAAEEQQPDRSRSHSEGSPVGSAPRKWSRWLRSSV